MQAGRQVADHGLQLGDLSLLLVDLAAKLEHRMILQGQAGLQFVNARL
jgi:hypothetical protein